MVTAGNSGAHMAISLFTLGRLAHVTRPAIGVVVPFIDGNHGLLLDVGASVDIGPKEYLVFAILGKTYFHTLFKKKTLSWLTQHWCRRRKGHKSASGST